MKKDSIAGKAITVTILLSFMIISMIYGIMSAKRENWVYGVYHALYVKKQQLFQKEEKTPRAVNRQTGLWHKARQDNSDIILTEKQKKALDGLNALPYLRGYNVAPDTRNVTIYDKASAYDGINFVLSSDAPHAFLMDMEGNLLHEWSIDFKEVWPERADSTMQRLQQQYWRRARLMSNGDVLAIFANHGLIRLDKHSNLLWKYTGECHHDMFEAKNGNIYALTHKTKKQKIPHIESFPGPDNIILEDFIAILSPEGKNLKDISLVECFLNSEYSRLLENIKQPFDILHTNTIRPIDGKLVNTYPMFKEGHLLVSFRDIHTIAVVDPEQEKITWALTGLWKFQHEPRLLENGNLALFDNRGNQGKTRIVEINPLTQEVVWVYKGEPAEAFYSKLAGTLERLPNGNTLITESEGGRAFEVTRAGEMVWEFYNPNRAGENNELIAALYDVIRFDKDYVKWLVCDSEPD